MPKKSPKFVTPAPVRNSTWGQFKEAWNLLLASAKKPRLATS